MFRTSIMRALTIVSMTWLAAAALAESGQRSFEVATGAKLVLDLEAGGDVEIRGTGGSSVIVDYHSECRPACTIDFEETGTGLTVRTAFARSAGSQSSNAELTIQVPRFLDVELDSMGGGLSIDGVDGTFTGKTMGGKLTLRDVRGEARLTTMGGRIELTDAELDGYLKTMGGEVLFKDVIGDVKGSSMGGDVRYQNVVRRSGHAASPARTGADLDEIGPASELVSSMGGAIRIQDAPEGADLHTMGGDIEVGDAQVFARAKTMGGDIRIDSIDGWVKATTMAGHVDVTVTGAGGDVELVSMSGDIELTVPSRFGMHLDLEIAFTRNSRKDYRIDAPGGLASAVTPEWDYSQGTPRKRIAMTGAVDGGGHSVKVRTVNGNITIRER